MLFRSVRTRKLWRIDRLNNKEYLLIVSETKPSLEHLELYGVEGTAKVKDYDHFLDQIEEGKSYRFRVTLNPVVAQMSGERGKRGKVSPVYNYEQIKFLNDRSKKNGFNLNENEFYIINRGHVSLKRAGHREVNLNKAIYEGRLTVVDKNTFIKAFAEAFRSAVEAKGGSLYFSEAAGADKAAFSAADVWVFGSPASGTEEVNDTEILPLIEELEDGHTISISLKE